MHILTADKRKIELEVLEVPPSLRLAPTGPEAAPPEFFLEPSPVARASLAFFELGREAGKREGAARAPAIPPAVFREKETGVIRTVYHEIVLRFDAAASEPRRRSILRKHRLEVRRVNTFVPDQIVVADAGAKKAGADLVALANAIAQDDEVLFATPNFVSEYRRQARGPSVSAEQWHLRNEGNAAGQRKGEDVDALEAWKITMGKPSVVVAILDDGVDIDHPNLKTRIWRNRNRRSRDRVGRDFFLPDDHPDHFNPRPKKFHFPFDQMRGNDIHGTPCAGVVAAAGHGAYGLAWRCRILPVKIFHADDLAADERVANAIRYAARYADVLSCSWTSGTSPDIELALVDAGEVRRGRGAPVFCATGNESSRVGYPAADPNTVAVGASTDRGTLASYSNTGREVDVVAPSSGGIQGIFTTDVSVPGRGFNIGRGESGGKDGLHTNDFGGTSSATPLAGGVAALVLSVNPKLDREEVRGILRETADKIGSGYDAAGHSLRYGYGRVNAARAVEAARPR